MKPIPGFPGYSITPDGRIFKGDKEIKRRDTWEGYPRVRLTGPDGLKNRKVHRLIAHAYLGESDEVRHLDNDRSNVHLDNLAIGDRLSNAKDRLDRGSYHHKTFLLDGKSLLKKENGYYLPEYHANIVIGDAAKDKQHFGYDPEKKTYFISYHHDLPIEFASKSDLYEHMEKNAEWTSKRNAKGHAHKHAGEMGLSKAEYIKQAIASKKLKLTLVNTSADGSARYRTPTGDILVLNRNKDVITYFKPGNTRNKLKNAISALNGKNPQV